MNRVTDEMVRKACEEYENAFNDIPDGHPNEDYEGIAMRAALTAILPMLTDPENVKFDEGDLFWPESDGEECANDMHTLLSNMHENESIEEGEVIRISRARNLPSVYVTIVTDEDECFVGYKLSAAPQHEVTK